MSALGYWQTCAVRHPLSAKCQKRTWTAIAFRSAVVSVKRVVRTYRHIKTGWCSARRVAHLRMAAARNRHAADDGASNLWLCSSGGLRVTLVVGRRCAGRHQRKCKHNGRNNGSDCFHRNPLSISARRCRQRHCLPFVGKWCAVHFGQSHPHNVFADGGFGSRADIWVPTGRTSSQNAIIGR
jgi:hypothetical protein